MYRPRAIQCPPESFFLLGPRGTGKSTWLRHHLPEAKVIDLLDARTLYRLASTPGAFADELASLPRGAWVVVDEIQKLPELLNEVHRAIEGGGLKFALCGSSARKLHRAGVNLLAGRALLRGLWPYMPDELGAEFNLEQALRHGTLPVIWDSGLKDEKLESYVMTYLREEIQAEAQIRNLPAFTRFLKVAAVMHGQTLNVANIARECGVARPTVDSYLDILEQTLICRRLPAFEGKLRVKERKQPKLFWVDPGLVRAAKGQLLSGVSLEERGHLFEGLVCNTLWAYRDYRRSFTGLSYWAPGEKSGIEVDFIAARGDDKVAIEVKSGAHFHDSWCKGLRAFGSPPGVRRRIVVCPDSPDLRLADGIEVLSFRRFAGLLHADRLFDAAGA